MASRTAPPTDRGRHAAPRSDAGAAPRAAARPSFAEAPRRAAERVRGAAASGVASLRDRLGSRLSARGAARGTSAAPASVGTGVDEPRHRDRTDWGRIGAFGAGIAIGTLLGAGTALLLAPATGFETRVRLARSARRVGDQVADRWEDLGDAVRRNARRTTSQVSRSLVRSRWAAEDAWERRLATARARVRAQG